MQDFLNELNLLDGNLLWGVEPWRVVASIGLIFVGFASRKFIQIVFKAIGKRTKSTRIKWDDEVAELLPKPLALVLQVFIWRIAAVILRLPTEPVDTRTLVNQGLDVALMIGVVWVFFRVVDVLARVADRFSDTTETRIDDQAVPLLRKTLKVFLAVLGGVFIIQNLGYSVLSVITGLGIGGLALALAAQDSVANFFGSVVLFTDAPFQVDDYVEVGGVSGTVEEVGFRTTRIRQDDSSLVSVPNQTFTATNIVNYSERKGRVVSFEFAVFPPEDPGQLNSLLQALRDAFANHEQIRADSAEVFLTGIKESSLKVSARAMTKYNGWTLFLQTREEMLFALLTALSDHGMQMANSAETIVVHVDAPELGDGIADFPPVAGPEMGEA